MNKPFKLILCLLLTLSVGAFSGIATAKGVVTWYPALHKPPFNPPAFLFAPVWTVLYLLMGVSLYLVLQQEDAIHKRRAVIIFSIQLLLNFCWSFIFFKFQLLGLALFEIAVMWLFIIGMITSFYAIHKRAGLLQIPYLLWVSFATLLNASIWYLN